MANESSSNVMTSSAEKIYMYVIHIHTKIPTHILKETTAF